MEPSAPTSLSAPRLIADRSADNDKIELVMK
jgi:hypothetical protein